MRHHRRPASAAAHTVLALSGAALTVTTLSTLATLPAAATTATTAAQPAGAVTARAAAGSTALVSASGLQITGNAVANRLVLGQQSRRYLVTDARPVQAGPGCRGVDVPGPRFGVTCRIVLTSNGQLRSVTVRTGDGDDTFLNSSAAPVRADGQGGDDRLVGGPRGDALSDNAGRNVLEGRGNADSLSTDFGSDPLPDLLRGGPGDDDLRAGDSDDTLAGDDGDDTMRGGLGADDFTGGTGGADAVVYLDNDHDETQPVIASIDGTANDGIQGEADDIGTDVEQLFGARADDILTGSDDDDRLSGNLGNDVLVGLRGADTLRGGPGNDLLASNQVFGAPVADGDIDVLNGESDTDSCRIPFTVVEDDATISCEIVNED